MAKKKLTKHRRGRPVTKRRGRVDNLKPFSKDDPRINRAGRPKDIEGLKAAVIAFQNEPSGRNKTRLERQMLRMEKTDFGRKMLWEYGYGKVPDKWEGTADLRLHYEGLTAVLQRIYGKHDASNKRKGT